MSGTSLATPVPVTVVAGFLGSGKTTLLNALLRSAAPRERVAVIVNEFGAIGIDGAMVEGGEQFVELDNGCLCCALNEDLQKTLEALVARGNVDRILIETTGLADPLPVAWSCTRPEVADALRLDAIVVLLDARAGPEVLAAHAEARLQVERADLLCIAKMDLVADDGRRALAAARALNAHAPVLYAEPSAWPLSPLLGREPVPTSASGRPGPEVRPRGTHSHVDGAIDSVTWTSPLADGPIDEAALEALAFSVPSEVVRFKALVWVDAREGPWLLIHGVSGRIDLRFCAPDTPPPSSVMVFFGKAIAALDLPAMCQRALRP